MKEKEMENKKHYKVAIVCDWYLPRIGGLELHLHDLARELNRRGHQAHIICTTPLHGNPESANGVKVHRLGVPLLPGFEFIRNKHPSAKLLKNIFFKEKFDIVHCHAILSPFSHVALSVAKELSIPTVLTEHSVANQAVFSGLRLAKLFYRWDYRPTLLSAVSKFVAKQLSQVTDREVSILYNGIDLSEWVNPDDSKKYLVSSVMRFTPRKRPVEVIRAIPQVYRQLPPDLRPRFALVGDGRDMPRVVREANRLGVRKFVDLPGFQSREGVRQILAQSLVFILPTLQESLSISTLQALAAGVPVVAMNSGGVGEILQHGEEGFLANNIVEFTGYIARILRDENLRMRMVKNSKKRLHRFTWDNIIPDHVRIYQRTLEQASFAPLPGEAVEAKETSPIPAAVGGGR